MGATKGSYLGTEVERIQAYYKERSNNLKITLLESRLSELHRQGIIESPEIDNILSEIAQIQSDLKWSIGLD